MNERNFATIGTIYENGVTLIFDGETVETQKRYLCNASASLSAGDRVKIVAVDGTYIVEYAIGKPNSGGSPVSPGSSGDMLSSVYDPHGKQTDIFGYADGLLRNIDATKVVFNDGQTWQQKYEAGELDGEKGDPGYTPQKGKDYFDGAPGYTPQKNIDYWTDADKAEIVNDVLEALPSAEGVRF